jgi:hypothetical protein
MDRERFNRESLVNLHEEVCAKSREILAKKNHDYCGQSVFANLAVAEHLGITSAEEGTLIRLMDKLMRLKNYLKSGEFHVTDEGLMDIQYDVINYIILIMAMIRVKEGDLPPDGDLIKGNPKDGGS